MKKAVLSAVLFMIAFAATYVACCYLVPGWIIKLEADPLTYLLESLKHMVLLKGFISLVAGLIAGAIPTIIYKIAKQ